MIIYKDFTLSALLETCAKIHCTMGPNRKERHYQKCIMADLRHAGVPAAIEDPIPIFYRGECVFTGRADIVIGFCCVELKRMNKPPGSAAQQTLDYIREKNKQYFLEHGRRPFWGLVINFNPAKFRVEHLVLKDETESSFFTDAPNEADDTRKHRNLMHYLSRFTEFHLKKTKNASQYVLMDELLEEFESSCNKQIKNTVEALWVKKYMQRHYRVAYERFGGGKRLVVYGGVGRGLVMF